MTPRIVIGRLPRRPTGETEETIRISLSTRSIQRHGEFRVFSKTAFWIVLGILSRRGETASRRDLMDFVYGDDPEGGPLTRAMDNRMCQIRPSLLALDIVIVNDYGRGWRATFAPATEAMAA